MSGAKKITNLNLVKDKKKKLDLGLVLFLQEKLFLN